MSQRVNGSMGFTNTGECTENQYTRMSQRVNGFMNSLTTHELFFLSALCDSAVK